MAAAGRMMQIEYLPYLFVYCCAPEWFMFMLPKSGTITWATVPRTLNQRSIYCCFSNWRRGGVLSWRGASTWVSFLLLKVLTGCDALFLCSGCAFSLMTRSLFSLRGGSCACGLGLGWSFVCGWKVRTGSFALFGFSAGVY